MFIIRKITKFYATIYARLYLHNKVIAFSTRSFNFLPARHYASAGIIYGLMVTLPVFFDTHQSQYSTLC